MKRFLCIILSAMLAIGCMNLCASADVQENWFTAMGLMDKGYTIDGETLVFPQDVQTMGEAPYDENDEPMPWDEHAIILSCEEVISRHTGLTGIRLPEALRTMGYDSLAYLRSDTLEIPGQVEIMNHCFYSCAVHTLILPASLREITQGTLNEILYDELILSPDNPYFSVSDNVLYSKDGETLLYYPQNRENAHFDVPAGVKEIADGAFRGNVSLQNVSLPLGLQRIGMAAFSGCGRLNMVQLPLTVKEIGAYAFSDCVSLTSAILPDAFAALISDGDKEALNGQYPDIECYADTVFDNCPLLNGQDGFGGDNDRTETALYDDTYSFCWESPLTLIANPSSAKGSIPVFRAADVSSPWRTLACGATVQGTKEPVTIAGLRLNSDQYYYLSGGLEVVRRDDVVALPSFSTVFGYMTCTPNVKKLSCRESMSPDAATRIIPKDEIVYCNVDMPGTPWVYVEGLNASGYAFIGDFTLTSWDDGSSKKYGVVVASEPRNRVNLRTEPSAGARTSGKYFSGTQVEILGKKKDFYQVQIGDLTGYMSKDYVREVKTYER